MAATLSLLKRVLGHASAPPRRMLDGFVDSLLQTFENCRPGLRDETIASGGTAAFFGDLYEKEVERLREQVRRTQTHLSATERDDLFRRVDDRVRQVVLPAYVRLTAAHTRRERNDFYVVPEALHGAERVGWAVLGLLLGAFVVWAPFIPLWSKEWVLAFGLGGFLFPGLRRVFALRRYQGALDELVQRTDDEIWRMDMNLITAAVSRGQEAVPNAAEAPIDAGVDAAAEALRGRLREVPAETGGAGRRTREREGGV
jgi:hypothetical protein